MSGKLWDHLCQPRLQLQPTKVHLQAANGHPIPTLGEVQLDIEPFGPHIVYICGQLDYDILIGSDILDNANCVVDYVNKVLQCKGRMLPLRMAKNDQYFIPHVDQVLMVCDNSTPEFMQDINTHPVFREEIGHCTVGEPATINTTGPPIKQRAYRLPLLKRKIVEEELDKMLAAGVIRPSQSPWASPITLVAKRDGSTRFCVDFRKVNASTVKDAYPLPMIQDIFDTMQGATIFTTLDLRSGYWQVDMDPRDIHKTAFTTHRGLFEWCRLPFGLTNAPSQFQRLMNKILHKLIGRTCLVYLDDIVVFSKTKQEHQQHVAEILDVINDAGMTLKRQKCFFGQEEVNLLGYVVSAKGIAAQEDKLSAIKNMAPPTDVKAVQRFLGVTGYYRQLIPRYADVATPLFGLTRKGEPWRWGTEENAAFEELKMALTSDTIMAHPDPKKPFRLYTDASEVAVGAVLTQVDDDGVERPIHYVSKGFSTSQRRWSAIEREAFAIVHSLRKLQPYLQGADLTILTDHKPLRSIFQCELKNSKVQRWAMLISEFAPKIEYRKGSDNIRADMLSRLPPPSNIATIQEALETTKLGDEQRAFFPKEWADADADEDTSEYALLGGELYTLRTPYQGAVAYPRLMAPPSIRPRLLNEAHTETGHRGRHALLRRLQAFSVWPGMAADAKLRIKACVHCQGNQRNHQKTRPEITDTPTRPFERIGLDLTGPFLPSSKGNKYLMCAVDHLTGWAESIPIRDKRSSTVWEALTTQVFPRQGHPDVIITDNGLEFMSNAFQDGLRSLNIIHKKTTPIHPQTNGVVERFHRTLKDSLRKLMNNNTSSWEDQLADAMWAYRISDSEARGSSPYELLYGFPANMPHLEDLKDSRFSSMARARQHAHDLQVTAKRKRQERSRFLRLSDRKIQPGDLITIDQTEPVTLSYLRDHCFKVTEVRGKVISYTKPQGRHPNKLYRVHIDRVRTVDPEISWEDINPRPRRSRKGPDVRTLTVLPSFPEHTNSEEEEEDQEAEALDDPETAPVQDVIIQRPSQSPRSSQAVQAQRPQSPHSSQTAQAPLLQTHPSTSPSSSRPVRTRRPPQWLMDTDYVPTMKRPRETDSEDEETEPPTVLQRVATVGRPCY